MNSHASHSHACLFINDSAGRFLTPYPLHPSLPPPFPPAHDVFWFLNSDAGCRRQDERNEQAQGPFGRGRCLLKNRPPSRLERGRILPRVEDVQPGKQEAAAGDRPAQRQDQAQGRRDEAAAREGRFGAAKEGRRRRLAAASFLPRDDGQDVRRRARHAAREV